MTRDWSRAPPAYERASTIAVPAGGPMSLPLLFVDRPLGAAEIVGPVAARREGAAVRQGEQRRYHAGDLLQTVGGVPDLAAQQVEPRDRGQQPHRVGMQRPGEQLAHLGLLDLAAGIHDDDP